MQPTARAAKRFRLATSESTPLQGIRADHLQIVPDVQGSESVQQGIMADAQGSKSKQAVMTDGAGFIAADIAADALQLEPHLLPTVLQIRCFSHLGGFKGTLTVRNDLHGKVGFRPSMRKMGPSLGLDLIQEPRIELVVCSHFIVSRKSRMHAS